MASHKMMTAARVAAVTASLGFLFCIVAVSAVCLGPVHIGIARTVKAIIFALLHCDTGTLSDPERTILFALRIPRVIFAAIVGGALAIAGTVFQAVLRNPLAEPYILGISAGSAVGALTGIFITNLYDFALVVPGLAFGGALLTIFIVGAISIREGRLHSDTLLLAGVMINAFFSAIIMVLISLSRNAELNMITFWMMGNLGAAGKPEIIMTGTGLIIGFILIYINAKPLNVMAVGEETALHAGVDVEKTKNILFLAASLMSALAVSFCGIIGFIGFVIPHIARMIFGVDHRLLLPVVLLMGASFLVAADAAARTIIPYTELPVGVITAFCGAPYFAYLLRKRSG